jgi:hypothetical protein
VILVQKASAIQYGTEESDKLPIDKDHSDLVKFDEGSEEYQVLFTKIRQIVRAEGEPQPIRPAKRTPRYSHTKENPKGVCVIM